MYNKSLYTFIRVVECGSFKKASEVLYLSNVAVIKQINQLEDMYGFSLFYRGNRGISLTPAGQSLYHDTLHIMNISHEALARARKIATSEKSLIRLGTSILRSSQTIIPLFEQFQKVNKISFQLEIIPFRDGPNDLNNMVNELGKTIDCFVTPCDLVKWQQQYNVHVLEYVPARIGVPKSNPLSQKDRLTWSDLEGETFFTFRRGEAPTVDRIRDEIRKNCPHMSVVDFIPPYTTETFNTCVKMGYLIQSLDTWQAVHPSITVLPMEWDIRMPVCLITSKAPSNLTNEFINQIIQLEEMKKAQY